MKYCAQFHPTTMEVLYLLEIRDSCLHLGITVKNCHNHSCVIHYCHLPHPIHHPPFNIHYQNMGFIQLPQLLWFSASCPKELVCACFLEFSLHVYLLILYAFNFIQYDWTGKFGNMLIIFYFTLSLVMNSVF